MIGLGRLLDWWHESQPAVFGPRLRFPHLVAADDDYDIADDRRAELIALDSITDQLDAIVGLLEDLRTAVNHLILAERTPR